MKKTKNNAHRLQQQAIEAHITTLAANLNAFIKVQTRTAPQNMPRELCKLLFDNPMRMKTQEAINAIKGAETPAAEMASAADFAATAKQKLRLLLLELNDLQTEEMALVGKLKRTDNVLLSLLRKLYVPTALVAGIADGAFTFDTCINNGLPLIQAGTVSVMVAAGIVVIPHMCNSWLDASKSERIKLQRTIICLGAAFGAFIGFGAIRTNNSFAGPDISVPGNDVQTPAPELNLFSSAIPSFIIFLIMFCFDRFLSGKQSKDAQADAYALEDNRTQQEKIKAEIKDIEATQAAHEYDAMTTVEMVQRGVSEAVAICEAARATFQSMYSRMYPDQPIPSYFGEPFAPFNTALSIHQA